jgi:DNA-binding NarL/FixJ family response regulator
MITVLIARDPSLVHLAASTPLCAAPDLWVLGTVADGVGVAQAVSILRPDVLMLDSMRLSLSAVEVTQQVTGRCARTRVVIVSTHGEQTSLIRALRSGVAGVVLRPFDPAELMHAVRAAANGGHHLSPRLWQALEKRTDKIRGSEALAARLTVAEHQLLELVAAGHSAIGMSVRLSLARTVAAARCRTLMQKLGLRTPPDLVVYALRWQVVAGRQRGPGPPWNLH